jgi:DeoR/GlpR family transcriptional regulator of sugar metabolism
MMLTAERKALLLARVERDGRLVAKDVAGELDVSEDTIRRDLRELAAEGRVQRVHGGALRASPAVAAFGARQGIETVGKQRVASLAASLVDDDQTMVLDGGTTALAVARALRPDLRATVITHSPTIAVALVDHPTVEVFLVGGRLFKHSVVTCGAVALEAIQSFRADVCFLGVTGVHPEAGLTTGDAEEAAVKRALGRRCADTYILASAEKIGAASPYRVIGWDEVTAVLTDPGAPAATVRRLRRRVDVRIAGFPEKGHR